MPATEQTWRNPKLLHLVFGVTSVAMLGTTVWMLGADHAREWKNYQRKFRDVETWTAQSRVDSQETAAFAVERKKLIAHLEEVRAEVLDNKLIDEFKKKAAERAKENGYDLVAITRANDALNSARPVIQDQQQLIARHDQVLKSLDAVLKLARFDEDNKQLALKSDRALLDDVRSRYAVGVDEELDAKTLAEIQKLADAQVKLVDEKTLEAQAAKTHRLALQDIFTDITAKETAGIKAIADHDANLKRAKTAYEERSPNWRKSILELPIIDAFGRPLEIKQIWLPQLTLNNNFRDVARFDRCTTCHQGIDKTAPGAALQPGYEPIQALTLTLATPKTDPNEVKPAATKPADAKAKDKPASDKTAEAKPEPATLTQVYGMKLADKGLIDPADVTVEVVWPETAAARAELLPGDVVTHINDVKMLDKSKAMTYLLGSVDWGKPLTIKVRRGVPHPFSTHPKLDLFVGSLSPHKMGDIGCTICHEGQGSATDFKWASHTPNTPQEGEVWKRDHGWFNNHHWIFPMYPKRFAESSCLKCHHEVAELEASERFPDPPAAKLMSGYNVIRQFGCFGCHEINGFDGPNKRRGPDLRAEPNFYAAAAEVLIDPALGKNERRLAQEVIAHPELEENRKLLAEMIRNSGFSDNSKEIDAPPSKAPKKGPQISDVTLRMAGILGADELTPGKLRKVGPSLRHVGSKVDLKFLYSWIREPKDFRPSTKMPQFFGLYDHLVPDQKLDDKGRLVTVESPGLRDSERFEPVEIRAAAAYLLSASEPFEYLDRPKGVTEDPSAERGKLDFQSRGCLACHQHPDFKAGHASQGPDLARLGSKLSGKNGARWLYSWVRAPNRYHSRTVMPNLFLEPSKNADGKVTDPAADITAYLLASQGWKPKELPEIDKAALDDLVKMFLAGTFTKKQSADFAAGGIPASYKSELKGDEAALVADGKLTPEELQEKKLIYVGRRTISRYGCSACHDIPGYEDAKPIGTGLADWGRKETSKLAFEQIVPYLEKKYGSHKHHSSEDHHAAGAHAEKTEADEEHGELDVKHMDPEIGFFIDAMLNHQREGFIWQKLREPRSYDFKKTENKDYTDRLRMPKFNFTDEQSEAVMTFVLGLVAEPPAAKYVYQAKPRQLAIQKGEQLLAKYNCTGCHTVDMEQWAIDYKPFNPKDDASFQPPPPTIDYPFTLPHFTPEQLAASKKFDRRGLGHAILTGVPNPEVQEDDEGRPLYYFELWKNIPIDGHAWPVGGQEVPVPAASLKGKRPPRGGDFARLLHPIVLENEKKTNPNAKASDAWGWVPPPLVGEGHKVQSPWLHDFLLDPYQIRPAVVALRMPKFNMSSDEASDLANYFAARDDADYPYQFDARTRGDYLTSEENDHPHRLGDALKVITDNNYCVKCHLVGDFAPTGAVSAQAPRLDRVSNRLRPDFLQKWLANPKRQLPYTGMPVNFPIDKPADQKLYKGDSEEQVQAVVDLLLNWAEFMKEKTSIKPLVKPAAAPPANAGAAK
jgi:cytochrome c551/c552